VLHTVGGVVFQRRLRMVSESVHANSTLVPVRVRDTTVTSPMAGKAVTVVVAAAASASTLFARAVKSAAAVKKVTSLTTTNQRRQEHALMVKQVSIHTLSLTTSLVNDANATLRTVSTTTLAVISDIGVQ
jgi:hypothetical protein